MLMYDEESFRDSYIEHKRYLIDLFGDRVDIPTIEEYRIQYEDEVLMDYYENYEDYEDDDD